jgi:hypothetical protein
VCDVDIDPSSGAGGLVTFQPDDHSREVRRRFEEEGLVGHPPDTEWFCAAHVDLAREVARTWTLPGGLRQVEARSRAIDTTTHPFPDPVGLPESVVIPTRSADGLHRVIRDRRGSLVTALGGDRMEARVSSSVRLDADHDRSVSHSTVGPLDVLDRVEYRRIGGELVAQLVELRVERAGAPLAIVRCAPLDRLQIWVGDGRLQEWADTLAADLARPPVDLLDPEPDLVDADLGAGRLAASDGFGIRWVQWDIDDVESAVALTALRGELSALVAEVTGGCTPPLESSTDRQWTPMDGAVAPYCPFTETTVQRGRCDDATLVTLKVEYDQWNEDDVSNASVSLAIGEQVSVVAFGATGGGDSLRTVRLYRPTTPAIVSIVDRAVSAFGSDAAAASATDD